MQIVQQRSAGIEVHFAHVNKQSTPVSVYWMQVRSNPGHHTGVAAAEFLLNIAHVCLCLGKLPEEAKEVQMSGQQQGAGARSRQGAESKDGNKSTHKLSQKLDN